MLNTTMRRLRDALRKPEPAPARFVYNPPWRDWTAVLNHLRKAEDAVLAYAERTDLPAGVASQMTHAAEQIQAGRRHDLMRLCRRSVTDPHYKPCCSHVEDALAVRELATTKS